MNVIPLYNKKGKIINKIKLNKKIFNVKINKHLLYLYVIQYLCNQRNGNQKAKTRSEVRGGGKKPWKQKGTGRARQGSIRSPQWVGGGVVFAPKPRNYRIKMNKKEKRITLKYALINKINNNKLIIIDCLKFDNIKTKNIKFFLDNFNISKAIIVLDDNNKNILLSVRNIPNIAVTSVNIINTYDILKYDIIIFTKLSISLFEKRLLYNE